MEFITQSAVKICYEFPAFAFLYLLGNAEKHGYRGMEQ